MGTKHAPLVADNIFLGKIFDVNQTDIIEAFNLTSRCLEDTFKFDDS